MKEEEAAAVALEMMTAMELNEAAEFDKKTMKMMMKTACSFCDDV